MAIEEEKCIEVILKTGEPVLKPIDLQDIGFLKREPTNVNCPACGGSTLSTVRLEAVTCFQRFLKLTKLCKTWESRNDINHYCGNCGCFIGRFIAIGCAERCISKSARRKAAVGDMSLKTKPKDCAANMQKMREHVKSEQAKETAKKEARIRAADEQAIAEGKQTRSGNMKKLMNE